MRKEIEITQEHWEWLGEALSRHANVKIAPTLVKLIMPGVRLFECSRNEALIMENDLGYEMYVIYEGTVEVSRGGKKIASLKTGDIFGEISLAVKAPRSATVKTSNKSQVFELSWRAVSALEECFPELMLNLQEVAHERMKGMVKELSKALPE